MTDIEIARNTELEQINKIAEKLNIDEDDIECYGKYKAKISNSVYEKLKDKKDGKLILVTAINPTPLGEGKTTVSIAIADGLSKIGKKSVLALREPSLGPVFGIKGGATGGGRSQVAPMEDINLHFTGDIHAITSANNLLASIIDNHIYFGNELDIQEITWKRCVDLNDRQLRKVETGLSGEKNIVPREDGFDITVASEIMAILCLSENIRDLKEKLDNVVSKIKSVDTEEVKAMFEEKVDEIKAELEDLDKEKALKIAKKKGEDVKKKCQDLVNLAVAKGTPVLEKAAEELRLKAIDVVSDVLEKLESKESKESKAK